MIAQDVVDISLTQNRSWVTYYFRSRFNLEEGRLGSLFFTTSIVSAVSVALASSLAKRLGNVKVGRLMNASQLKSGSILG